MSEQEARILQNYKLEQTLGKGTFGKVKLAIHTVSNEKVVKVAIKILEKCKIETQADLERVKRELYILRKIKHPHLIQIYEILESDASIYLVMEYVKGGELFDYIVSRQKLRETAAARFLLQVVDALEYLHERRIAHRGGDIKPENLLLDEHNNIKVIDFGLSNIYREDGLLKTACGSPCYAAPEMLCKEDISLDGLPYGGRKSDIWSCGIVLFAMICGFLPFEDNNTSELYKKIKTQDYEKPDHLSAAALDLLAKLLCKDPLKRHDFDQIRAHAFCTRKQVHYVPLDPLDHAHLDLELVDRVCALHHLKRDHLIDMILNNKHNNYTTTYALLLKAQLNNYTIQRIVNSGAIIRRPNQKIKTEYNDHPYVSSTGGSSSKDLKKQALSSLQNTILKKKKPPSQKFFQDYNDVRHITNSINMRAKSHHRTAISSNSPDKQYLNLTQPISKRTPGWIKWYAAGPLMEREVCLHKSGQKILFDAANLQYGKQEASEISVINQTEFYPQEGSEVSKLGATKPLLRERLNPRFFLQGKFKSATHDKQKKLDYKRVVLIIFNPPQVLNDSSIIENEAKHKSAGPQSPHQGYKKSISSKLKQIQRVKNPRNKYMKLNEQGNAYALKGKQQQEYIRVRNYVNDSREAAFYQ